jgi:hypothetical protein
MDLAPPGGKEQTFSMTKVTTAMADPAKEKADPKAKVEPKPMTKPMVCGQVKDMDPYYVELVVVPVGMEKAAGDGEGYLHTHGGPHFKAVLAWGWWADSKTPEAIAFEADIHFAYGKDRKLVKGYSYPHGLYRDVLQKVMDEDLKQARDYVKANDAAKWKEVAERIQVKTHALPELTFKKAEDRTEFERGKADCMVACDRLRTATTSDEALKAIDACAEKCDDYQDESQDAEGVNWDSKVYDPKKVEPKPPAETPKK